MGRGARPDGGAGSPRTPRDTLRAARLVAGRWSDLYALGEAVVLIPEKDPSAGHPERMRLTAWRAKEIPGGWQPVEELTEGMKHVDDPWRIKWPWMEQSSPSNRDD